MSKTDITNKLTRTVHKLGFKLKKHSPEILVVTGVVGTVASAVMACKATLKVNEITDEAKANIEKIHEAKEAGATAVGKEYTEQDSKKDLTIVYTQTGLKLAKLYAPALIIGGLSITAVLTGHNITRKRNMALAAAYSAVDKGFKEYRGRVIERFGEDLDRELRHNIKAKEVEETVVNEDGTETTVTRVVEAMNPMDISEYAKFFDDGCTGWTKDPELNLMFLKSQERYANERLRAKGILYLNEVYDLLGIHRTKAGQVVGWVYDEQNPNGDNYVDFGIYNLHNEAKRNFVNGFERSILLDFNVDGNVLDFM